MSSGGGLVKIVGIGKEHLRDFMEIEVDPVVWEEFTRRRNGALLGIDIAEDREMRGRYVWEQGREFVLADMGGLSLYMAGTFTPRDPTLRSVILTGDVFLQEADNRRGVANQLLVRIANRDEGVRIGAAIDALDAPVKLHAETQQAALDQAIGDLDEMLRYARAVIAVVAVVILVGLANATSMAVRDRAREIGVLRSMGFSRRRIVLLVASETLLVAVAGGLLGCGAAWALVAAGSSTVSVGSYTFPVTLPAPVAMAALFAAGVVGLLGGLPAGVRASRLPIVESLRSVD